MVPVFQASFFGSIGRFPPRSSFFFSYMNYVFLRYRYIGSAYEGTGLGQVLPAYISIIVMAMSLPAWTVCLSSALLTILIMILLYVFLIKSPFYRHHSGLDDEDPRGPSISDFLTVLKSTWLYFLLVFLDYAVTISVHPNITALVKPVSPRILFHGNKSIF